VSQIDALSARTGARSHSRELVPNGRSAAEEGALYEFQMELFAPKTL